MRRILIISEQDLVFHRLHHLANLIYSDQKRELLHCQIDIIDCKHQMTVKPYESMYQKHLASGISKMPATTVFNTPLKTYHAKSCNEISRILKEHKIEMVIVPIFTYDKQRSSQYLQIIQEVKKLGRIEVIGLYI